MPKHNSRRFKCQDGFNFNVFFFFQIMDFLRIYTNLLTDPVRVLSTQVAVSIARQLLATNSLCPHLVIFELTCLCIHKLNFFLSSLCPSGAALNAKDFGRQLTARDWALFTGRYETAWVMTRLIERPCPHQYCDTYRYNSQLAV